MGAPTHPKLSIEYLRPLLRDPMLRGWTLEKYLDWRYYDEAAAYEWLNVLFDDVTLEQILTASYESSSPSLFSCLPHERFKPFVDEVFALWPDAHGFEQRHLAEVLAHLDVERAGALFLDTLSKADEEGKAETLEALELLSSLGPLLPAVEQAGTNPELMNSSPDDKQLLDIVRSAARGDMDAFIPILNVLLRAPDSETEEDLDFDLDSETEDSIEGDGEDWDWREGIEFRLRNIGIFLHGTNFTEHLIESFLGDAGFCCTELAPWCIDSAPLARLDAALDTMDAAVILGEARALLEEHGSTSANPLAVWMQAHVSELEHPNTEHCQLDLALFMMGVLLDGWRDPNPDFSMLSLDACIKMASTDISVLPDLAPLIERLRQFPADDVLRQLKRRLPALREYWGYCHFSDIAGELRLLKFIPQLIDGMSDDMPSVTAEHAMNALCKLGAEAENAIIAQSEKFDSSQKIYGYGVLENIGGKKSRDFFLDLLQSRSLDAVAELCSSLRSLPDERYIKPLEPWLRTDHNEIDEVFVTLCKLFQVDHPKREQKEELLALREEVMRERTRQVRSGLQGDETCFEMRCLACGGEHTLGVDTIYVDAFTPSDQYEIEGAPACPDCRATGSWTLAPKGYARALVELRRLIFASRLDKPYDGPLSGLLLVLPDGDRASPGKTMRIADEQLVNTPEDARWLLAKALALENLDRNAEAEGFYRKALKHNPRCMGAAFELAFILANRDLTREAVRILRTATPIPPDPLNLYHPYMDPFQLLLSAAQQLDELESGEEPSEGDAIAQAPNSKAGPNDPCPCGSGKKYKKCCGRMV